MYHSASDIRVNLVNGKSGSLSAGSFPWLYICLRNPTPDHSQLCNCDTQNCGEHDPCQPTAILEGACLHQQQVVPQCCVWMQNLNQQNNSVGENHDRCQPYAPFGASTVGKHLSQAPGSTRHDVRDSQGHCCCKCCHLQCQTGVSE